MIAPEPYYKNPRQITQAQLEQLKSSLDMFGDLSGFIHDVNTNQWVGGHSRDAVIQVANCTVEIAQSFDPPLTDGTTAIGWVIWNDSRFNYRAVNWTPEKVEQANIQANSLGGKWDFDILANQFEVDSLLDWGFNEWTLGLDAKPKKTTKAKSNRESIDALRFHPLDFRTMSPDAIDACANLAAMRGRYGLVVVSADLHIVAGKDHVLAAIRQGETDIEAHKLQHNHDHPVCLYQLLTSPDFPHLTLGTNTNRIVELLDKLRGTYANDPVFKCWDNPPMDA